MKTKSVLFIGGAFGLLASSAVLILMWSGVSGILVVGHTHLRHLFWPSSIMLTADWCCTVPGVMITASSVAINCLLYMAITYSLWRIFRLITPH